MGVLLLAGCSGTASTQETGALSDYLGEYAARMDAGDEARALAAEEEVASCMHAQGFDYRPRPDGAWQSDLQEVPSARSTLTWAQEHGYGLVDGAGSTSVSIAPPDPNAQLVAAMSASERDAYEDALLGAAADDPLAEVDGCAGQAEQAATAWWDDATYAHYRDEASRIEGAVDQDAQVTTAVAGWRACVAERGHPELEALGDGLRLMTDEIAPFESGGPGRIPAAQKPRLLAREIELATTERACDEEVGLTRTRDGLVAAAQDAFVDEHRGELDAWALTWPTPTP